MGNSPEPTPQRERKPRKPSQATPTRRQVFTVGGCGELCAAPWPLQQTCIGTCSVFLGGRRTKTCLLCLVREHYLLVFFSSLQLPK